MDSVEKTSFMRVIVDGQSLKEAVNKTVNVVDKKKSRIILTFLLIEVRDNQIEVTASDLEVSAKVRVKAKVEGKATFCINPKSLSDILKELPDGELELLLKEEQNILELNCGSIHFSLLIQSGEEYPQLLFEDKKSRFQVNSDNLVKIIDKTYHAISNDDTRTYLNGIYLQEIDSKIRVVATDGHRLALLDTEIDNENAQPSAGGVIVPRKGVNELRRIAENFPKKMISISTDDSFVYASADDSHWLSIRLIASEYPKYQAVIPEKTSYVMRVDKKTIVNAVKRIKIMSSEKSNGVKVFFKNSELTLTSQNQALGEADEKIPVEYEGKEMEMAFNAKYLIETFSTLDDGEVSMELNNELSAVVIKESQSSNYLGVIMPLRL